MRSKILYSISIIIVLTLIGASWLFSRDRVSNDENIFDSLTEPKPGESLPSGIGVEPLEFELTYPESFRVADIPTDGGARIVIAEDISKEEEGLQIFITPYDEPLPNVERIKLDLPDKLIRNPRPATLDGVEVLTFESRMVQDIGDTFEVWAVYNGKLYQIVAYRSFAQGLQKILDSWQWMKNSE